MNEDLEKLADAARSAIRECVARMGVAMNLGDQQAAAYMRGHLIYLSDVMRRACGESAND